MRKAYIDGDSPAFLFFKAIRIYPRESLNKGRFTMIYVSGSTSNYVFHPVISW